MVYSRFAGRNDSNQHGRATMFSSRIEWGSGKNRLSALLDAKRGAGEEPLDLTVSNPTAVGFDYDTGHILRTLAAPETLAYHPSPQGSEAARQAVAGYYHDHGKKVSVESLFLTASTSEAYDQVLKLLCDPGDELLVPRPSYPLFEYLAALASVKIRPYPLVHDGKTGWRVDLDALAAAVGPRCRAIAVVNPNNPTGSFVTREELGFMNQLCRDADLALLVDEVFLDYPAPGVAWLSAAGNGGALTFTLSGLSKIQGLPQLKLGWIQVSGPRAEEARERLELVADTYLSVSAPAQAAAALLATRQGFQRQLLDRLESNETFLRRAVEEVPAAAVLRRSGGWCAIVSVESWSSDEKLALTLLDKDGVLVHPGFYYDIELENPCLVCSLITPPKVFRAGVERLLARL